MDVLKLAWALYRSPCRRWQRIGQLIENAAVTLDPRVTVSGGRPALFYQENGELIWHVREFHNRVNRAPDPQE